MATASGLARVAQINATIASQGQAAPNPTAGKNAVTLSNQSSANPADRYSPSAVAAEPTDAELGIKAPQKALPTPTPAPGAINTAQPSPQTAQVTPPNATTDLGQAVAGKGGALTSEEMNNPQTLSDYSSRYKAGLQAAKATGLQAPATQGGAAGVIQSTLPNAQQESPSVWPDVTGIDPNIDKNFVEHDEWMSPPVQKTTLLEEYNQLSKSLGIQALNEEMIDAKAIIEGTEEDIRNEITSAGGLATDSQVLAMANARNKSLVKNYNKLVDLRTATMDQLNTIMDLTIKDREMAAAEFDRKMNYAFRVAEFKERSVNNAREGYNNIVKNIGYSGLLQMTNGDPRNISTVEKTLGLGTGGLQKLAQYVKPLSEKESLELENQRLQNQKLNLDLGGNTPSGQLQLAQAQDSINSVDTLVKDPNIRSAVGPTFLGRLIGSGYDRATGGRQNFIAEVEKLRSNLNLDSLIEAKKKGATFGALSDQELQVLSNSATKIGQWAKKDKNGNVVAYNASEKDFKRELDKINNFSKLDYILKGGDPDTVGVQLNAAGKYVVRNSDGSITELN